MKIHIIIGKEIISLQHMSNLKFGPPPLLLSLIIHWRVQVTPNSGDKMREPLTRNIPYFSGSAENVTLPNEIKYEMNFKV